MLVEPGFSTFGSVYIIRLKHLSDDFLGHYFFFMNEVTTSLLCSCLFGFFSDDLVGSKNKRLEDTVIDRNSSGNNRI